MSTVTEPEEFIAEESKCEHLLLRFGDKELVNKTARRLQRVTGDWCIVEPCGYHYHILRIDPGGKKVTQL